MGFSAIFAGQPGCEELPGKARAIGAGRAPVVAVAIPYGVVGGVSGRRGGGGWYFEVRRWDIHIYARRKILNGVGIRLR